MCAINFKCLLLGSFIILSLISPILANRNMGQRKTKPTSAVRVRISRTQSVGKASLKSVTIRTSASGRISQTTAHADTVNEEYQAFQHIDDFCIPNDEAVLNDTSDPVSHSLGRKAVADDETKRSPVSQFVVL
jgi:5-hydroxyisourate hydrolase-like protein (transthyretin family)